MGLVAIFARDPEGSVAISRKNLPSPRLRMKHREISSKVIWR